VGVIRRGAEAEIRLGEFLGRDTVIKSRIPKRYRLKELDLVLRAQRTRNEAKLIQEARRCGVPTPIIYDVDLGTAEIVMERITGRRVKDVLSENPELIGPLCKEIGRLVALLHSNGIVHGDLTTSNMIYRDGKIWMIDFSLGSRSAEMEDIGVDVHLLKRAFMSAHSEIFDRFGEVIDSYCNNFAGCREALRKLEEIESRGRYT
jgi:TP53 regulating kinase-like protein